MASLEERDLVLDLVDGSDGRKFDDETVHALSHCMKAVDFIVEWDDRYWFVEFKDPENPNARPNDQRRFEEKFLGEQLDSDLMYKYRDSFLYEWAAGRAKKPIYYLVLVALERLSSAELLSRQDALRRKLPVEGRGASEWRRALVADCVVFNIETWNQHLGRSATVRRASA